MAKLMYQGSEAQQIDGFMGATSAQPQLVPSFKVHEGEGLDSEARKGVSKGFVSRSVLAIMSVVSLCLVGMAIVFIASLTTVTLQQSNKLTGQIETAQKLQGELRVEQSVLGRGSRISSIATDQYGMVLAGTPEKLVLSDSHTSQH